MTDGERKMRNDCFRDMQRVIRNAVKDYAPEYNGKEALEMLLESVTFMGPDGFGTDCPDNKARGQGPVTSNVRSD